MKRYIGFLVAGIIAASPLTAVAASFAAGQQYSLPAQKSVSGNLYVATGTATIGGRVTGDVYAVGGTLLLSGSVGGDVAIVGGTTEVLGPVEGDVRVVGGTVTINDRVGGDLVIAGGTVHILSGVVVAGDVVVAGGQAIIDGTISGSLRYTGGSLVINGTVQGDVSAKLDDRLEVSSTAVLRGALAYSAPDEAMVAPGARITGKISYDSTASNAAKSRAGHRILWAFLGIITGMKLLALLGLAGLLVWRWRHATLEVLSSVRDAFWQSLGHGLTYLILVPIAVVLLLISFIGTLPGVLLLLLGVAAMILAKALAGIFLGSWLAMVLSKRDVLHLSWGSALGGVVLLQIISIVPVLGWVVGAAVWLAVFGAVCRRIQHQLAAR